MSDQKTKLTQQEGNLFVGIQTQAKCLLKVIIIWLALRAGKMTQILRCDWLPERARWSYLARSGLPVARSLGMESLIPTTMQSFLRFSRCFGGKRSLKSSVNSQHLPKGKERE